MVPPIGTVVAGVNTMTGFMAAPATPPEVMAVNEVIVVPLVMDPVLIGPAEHELDDVTTENVFEASLSVVLKVRPDKIID
jgi:hypothetical protein